jgi:hypothetical protein
MRTSSIMASKPPNADISHFALNNPVSANGESGELVRWTERSPCIDAANHALLLGRCLLCEQALDVSSVVDWLLDEACEFSVVGKRIHVMGKSSGGTTALYAAALDIRLAAAMPNSCIGFLRDTILSRGDNSG